MSRLTLNEGINFDTHQIGEWLVMRLTAKRGARLVYTIDEEHVDEMHDSYTFLVRGRWLRYDANAKPGDDSRSFLYTTENGSHGIGYRHKGDWMHDVLDDDFIGFHVKLLRARPFEEQETFHPRQKRVALTNDYVVPQGELAVLASGHAIVGGHRIEPGQTIFAHTKSATMCGGGVLERFF